MHNNDSMTGLCSVFTFMVIFLKHIFGNFNVVTFENFILQYNKSYGSREEYQRRLLIFSENMEKARQLQKEELGSARYGVTKFSDLSDEEICRYTINTSGPHEPGLMNNYTLDDKPFKSCDWRKKGLISEVKDQGEICGSCWAFAVVSNIEAQFAILGNLKNLSVQQVIDCSSCGNGCAGGFTWDGFITVLEQGGLAKEDSYKYNGNENKCKKNVTVEASIAGFEMIPRNENVMYSHLTTKGTLTVIVNKQPLIGYLGGVINLSHECCDKNHNDHAVLIVGCSKDETGPYWILKNSWGSNWGENGYFRMHMGENVCGITKYPITALLNREKKGVRCPTDSS
uniref:Uncharacterized protein n=2 Tax=Leptobrachium leishanense TaxID=445787 RepID=A0A8C5MHR0_9ANUR